MKVKFLSLIAAVILLLSAGSVSAQCGIIRRGPIFHRSSCTPIVTQTVVVDTPVVVTTVAVVPVLVPAFQFQYLPPCAVPVPAGYTGQPGLVHGYGSQPVVNPGVGYGQPAPTGYGPQPGYGMPPVAQQQPLPAAPLVNNQDKIRELAKALLEEMQRQAPLDDDGPPAVPGAVGSPIAPSKTGVPPGLPQAIMSPEQAAPVAIAALQQNCSHCHTGPASKGEFVMFAQPGLFNQNIPWRSIIREIDAGRMPPRQSQFRLTADQAAAVRAWLSGI